MNLVLGAIYGYDWEKVKHFVISLRKHYDGKIAFIIDMDVMTNIEYVDDAGFVLRMKVMNKIEFLVDELMEDYQMTR